MSKRTGGQGFMLHNLKEVIETKPEMYKEVLTSACVAKPMPSVSCS